MLQGSPVRVRVSAFTLVELLVVIGIIALLISILLPALGRAQAAARTTVCKSNLKSIGQAIQIYANTYKGSLPFGFANPDVNGVASGGTHWVLLLQNTMNSKYGASWNDAFATNANTAKTRDIFFCPEGPVEDLKTALASGTTHYLSHPILMPQAQKSANYSTTGASGTFALPYKLSQIRAAAERALIMDGSVQYDDVAKVWKPKYEVPIANSLDRFALSKPNKLFLSWNGASVESQNIDLNSSVSMFPIGTTPSAIAVNSDSDDNQSNIRFRHNRDTVANVMMADGHVESFTFNKRKSPSDPAVTDFKRRYVYVNYVAGIAHN